MDNQIDNRFSHAFSVSPYNDPDKPELKFKMEIRQSFAGRKIRRFPKSFDEGIAIGNQLCAQIIEKGVGSVLNHGLTTRRAADWFFERLEKRKSQKKIGEKHVHDTKRVLNLLCDCVGRKPIEFVNAEEVERVINLPTAAATQANYFAALHAFFQACEDFEKIKRNPMRALEKPKARPRRNILTPDQMRDVLDQREQMEPWLFAAILISGFTGVRSAEVLRMNWDDIDTKSRQIHIREDVAKQTNSDGYDDRIIDFEPQLTRRVKFLKGNGKLVPVDEDEFYKARNRLVKLLGWERWPQNCLRHSAATYKLAECRNPAVVANMLGHKSSIRLVNTTYAVPAKRAGWKAWRAL